MNPSHLRPLGFGEILDSAFGLYRRHFLSLFITALVPIVPTSLLSSAYARAMAESNAAGGSVSFAPAFVVGQLVAMVMWGALAHQVSQAWTGGEVSVRDGYREGLRRFPPLVGASILAYLALFVGLGAVWAVAVIVMLSVATLAGGTGGATGAIAIVGVMIPVVLLMLALALCGGSALFAVLPAVVVERLGPVRALTRSLGLARGAYLRVTGVVLVSLLIVFLPLVGVMAVTGGFSAFTDPDSTKFWLQQSASSVASALTTPYLVASLVILYFDRRVRTEALDVQLAADALASG